MERRFGVTVDPAAGRGLHRDQGAGRLPPARAAPARPVPRHRALPGGVLPDLRDGRRAGRAAAPSPSRSTTTGTSTSSAVSEEDAARALLLWVNEPGNPTGSRAPPSRAGRRRRWARARGVDRRQRRVLRGVQLGRRRRPRPGATALAAGVDGVLAVHSLSKRSNMAGYRVRLLGRRRRARRLHRPDPHPRRADGARPDPGRGRRRLGDDAHVEVQQDRYAERRAFAKPAWPRPVWWTPAGRRRSTCGLRSADGARTAGRSPPGWPHRARWSPPATSTATPAPTTCASPWSQPARAPRAGLRPGRAPAGPHPAAADRLRQTTGGSDAVYDDLAKQITAAWEPATNPTACRPRSPTAVRRGHRPARPGRGPGGRGRRRRGRRPRVAEAGHPPVLPAPGPRDHRARARSSTATASRSSTATPRPGAGRARRLGPLGLLPRPRRHPHAVAT